MPVCRTRLAARRLGCGWLAALIAGLAGFASVGGGTHVRCTFYAKGVARHVVVELQRPVPAAPTARRFAARARPAAILLRPAGAF